jgi:hypothetical protein
MAAVIVQVIEYFPKDKRVRSVVISHQHRQIADRGRILKVEPAPPLGRQAAGNLSL